MTVKVRKAFIFQDEGDGVTHVAHDGTKVLAYCEIVHPLTDMEMLDCPVAKNWVLIRKSTSTK